MKLPDIFLPEKDLGERIQKLKEQPILKKRFPNLSSILNGKMFYNNFSKSLKEALEHVGQEGVVNMPEFVFAKSKTEKSHPFWCKNYDVHTEEDIGIDKKGTFYKRNELVLIVVHGGGILTPGRIEQARKEGLIDGGARYYKEEFDNLLEGKLSNGDTIPLYRLEEIEELNIPHRLGVVMPFEIALNTESGYHKKKSFLKNPLVTARAAGVLGWLEDYYEKSKGFYGDLGNYHPFKHIDVSVPQGRILFVGSSNTGLSGCNSLNGSGRFVTISPESKMDKDK